jgi:hypothetical protein
LFEKILFLLIVSLGMLGYDGPKLKQKNQRERVVYGMLMIPLFYLSLLYVMDTSWPNLHEFFDFFLLKPAHKIVEALMVTM